MQLNFGLAFDPLARGYRITPPGPANGGSASLLAFIDNNANGLFDPGEEPVPGVVLQGAARVMKTDAAGRAFVTGLGEGASAILRADTSSTDTVFVTSPPQNIAFAPRAGSVAQVLYPMVPSSELVIRLKFRQQDGTLTGLSAVRLQLVPETGAPVDGHTEFDGSVIFESMTPGHYRLQLEPDQAGKLGMRLVAPIELAVLADGRTVSAEGEVIFTRRSLQ